MATSTESVLAATGCDTRQMLLPPQPGLGVTSAHARYTVG